MYNPFSLIGKTILVTGASSGIGQATAIECSRMGATIIAVGRNQQRLSDTMNQLESGLHQSFSADLTNTEDLTNLINQLPTLDGVVCVAGINSTQLLQFASIVNQKAMFETNYFSTVELIRTLNKTKKIKKGGSIVALSSVAANLTHDLGNGVYGASKAALSAFVKYAAKEFAQRKVRVNAICPGMVQTPILNSMNLSEEQRNEAIKAYPLARLGQPQEIAQAAVYLLSDTTTWITGAELVIDGGLTL